MAGLEAMIGEAEKSLGLTENLGNNQNYITRWYGLTGPWCDMSITYWAWHSGNQGAVTFGGKYAYTVSHAQAFKAHGQWYTDVAGIRRGDIVFFDWALTNGIGAIDHVGIVTGVSGANVLTIEGNVGNVCARKVRHAAEIAGYGRPAYMSAAAVPKPKPPAAPTYIPFPGLAWFKTTPKSPTVTAMGKRLVAVGVGRYDVGPGPQWTDADKDSYAAWQRKCGFSGADANGWPGKTTWDKLKVPK